MSERERERERCVCVVVGGGGRRGERARRYPTSDLAIVAGALLAAHDAHTFPPLLADHAVLHHNENK